MTERLAHLGVTQADRRAATMHRLHATENLLARLDAALAGHDADCGDDLLRAACRALAGLVARTPGGDLVVSAGPDHGTAVRLWLDPDGELCVELVRRDSGATGPVTEVIPTHRNTATALASLLWSGGFDGEDGSPPIPPSLEA